MISRLPLRDEVYRQILDRIHRGELVPGSPIRDVPLSSELGVSRTPIREALLRLAADGVIESSVGRGFRVRPLDASEIREVGAVLGTLEALAIRLSPSPSPDRVERLAELDRQLERTRGDLARCLDLEDEWHGTLLEACPNQRLRELVVSLRQVPRRYLAAYMRDAGRLSLSTVAHGRILKALRSGGAAEAAAVFEEQWRRAIAELEAWTARTNPPEAGR
jgi:DNA-binding GntR family transcriptional regulator